jgi:hypothetical protein
LMTASIFFMAGLVFAPAFAAVGACRP